MRVCLICGEDLVGKRKGAEYCSRECRVIAWAKRRELEITDLRGIGYPDTDPNGRTGTLLGEVKVEPT